MPGKKKAVKKQPPVKKKGVSLSHQRPGPKGPPVKKGRAAPRKKPGRPASSGTPGSRLSQQRPLVPAAFADRRHEPSVETIEDLRYYEEFTSGNVTVRVNHKTLSTLVADVRKVAGHRDYNTVEKKKKYLQLIKKSVGASRCSDGYPDKDFHKNFTAIVELMKKKVPYREPNRHLSDFMHD